MASKHHNSRISSSSNNVSIRYSTILTISLLLITSLYIFISPFHHLFLEPFGSIDEPHRFKGDLRDASFPWNKLCFGQIHDKLRLAVFSKTWPMDAAPGGMERHAFTLYNALVARGHEIHVFTVPSDRMNHEDIHRGNLHVYFVPNDHGSLNYSLSLEIFGRMNADKAFDYVHTESVSLPYWRAKVVGDVAVTWHGIWYEIMHSKLFEELLTRNVKDDDINNPPVESTELQEIMPRLVDEIRFFSRYTQHICITQSASQTLTNIYQLPPRNVHVILNGVDDAKFINDPKTKFGFREKHGIPWNASLVIGVSGRLVKDKGHPLLYEAFSSMANRHPGVFLVVAGSGPWGRRYAELGRNVKVLGALESKELTKFYNAIDVFVNPTLRPQGLDLTMMEAMHCGKAVLAPNYPSIVGTVVVDGRYGYTFSPNLKSFMEALELVIKDGVNVLERKGLDCKKYAVSMFTATKMASAYERFFLCMKDTRYCRYPLPVDC